MIVLLLLGVIATICTTFIYAKLVKKFTKATLDEKQYQNKLKIFAVGFFLVFTFVVTVGQYIVLPMFLQ